MKIIDSDIYIIYIIYLNVIDEIEAENQRSEWRVYNREGSTWEDDSEDGKEQQHNDANKENSTHRREVPFSLEREDGEGGGDDNGDL